MAYDLLIKDAQILDGTGAPAFSGNVAVQDGTIVAVGNTTGTAARVIDAQGLTLAPGFIDIHTHMDAQLLWDPLATSSCWHGITTLVLGNCSFAIAPCKPQDHDYVLRTLVRVEGMSLEALQAGVDWAWETYPEYMDRLDRQLGMNVITFMGYSAMRQYVLGAEASERAATPEEIVRMRDLMRQGLTAGAYGFSFNFNPNHIAADGRPVPSRLASFDEVLTMAELLRGSQSGAIQIIGNPNPGAAATDNYDRLAQACQRPVLWLGVLQSYSQPGQWRTNLRAAEAHLAAGSLARPMCTPRTIDVLFNLKNAHIFDGFPTWKDVLTKGPDEVMAALQQPEVRAALRRDLEDPSIRGGFSRRWDLVEVIETVHQRNRHLERRCIADIAAEQGRDGLEVFLDLCLDERLDTEFLTVLANGDEAAAGEILQHPATVVGLSDAGAHAALECGYGFTTHMLGHWVREKGIMPLPEAVRKLTSMLADQLGLHDRGRIKTGLAADLVLFDPATVASLPATVAHDLPAGAKRFLQKASGISHTIVNGEVLMEHGEHVGTYPGHVLRRAAV